MQTDLLYKWGCLHGSFAVRAIPLFGRMLPSMLHTAVQMASCLFLYRKLLILRKIHKTNFSSIWAQAGSSRGLGWLRPYSYQVPVSSILLLLIFKA